MKRIVWDWNGTLFDDVALSFDCINTLLRRYHLPVLPSLEKYREVFDFPVKDYYQKVGFDFSKTPFEVLAHEYMELYQGLSYGCSLNPQAEKAIRLARSMNFDQSVLSASKKDYLLSQMKAVGFHMEAVYGIEDIYANSKLALANKYKKSCDPEDSVCFIGDSLHDYEVAKAVDADCILISTGHQSRARLLQAGVPVADSLPECLEICYDRG